MQTIDLRPLGLITRPNPLGLPAGAMVTAKNWLLERPGLLTSRRGFFRLGMAGGGIHAMLEFDGRIFANWGSGAATALGWRNPINFSAMSGTFTNQYETRMKAIVALGNCFFTTDEGVRRLQTDAAAGYVTTHAGGVKAIGFDMTGLTAVVAVGGLIRAAGVVTATTNAAHGFVVGQSVSMNSAGEAQFLNGYFVITGTPSATSFTYSDAAGNNTTSTAQQTFVRLTLSVGGSGSFLADGFRVAYRCVIGIKDPQGEEVVGSPSGRLLVANTEGTIGWNALGARNVDLRVLLPKDNNTTATALTTSHFIRVYRSPQVGTTALDAQGVPIEPSDDLHLVYQANLTSAQITAGFVEFTDSTPEAVLRGAFLYTSPNAGEGMVNANEPPPRARDIVYWHNRLWYARTRTRYRLTFTILSVVASSGLTAGDTLTIAGVTYTAVSSAPAADQFIVATGGTVTQNVEATAQNLIAAINRSANNTSIYAYSLSVSGGLPGKIYLEARAHAASQFSIIASDHGAAYLPNITAEVGAKQDAWDNCIFYSKSLQPEAVPLLNYKRVGPSNATIDRIFPLRDQLYVFTTAGLYRVTGTDSSNFTADIEPFDLAFKLMGRETLAVLDDHLYAWSTQGVARISEQGAEYVSNDIEPTLRSEYTRVTTVGLAPIELQKHSFAIGYQSEHKYLLGTIHGASSVEACYFWCFDSRTKAWTGPMQFGDVGGVPDGRSCGLIGQNEDLLYMADNNAADSWLYQERKARTAADFVDTLSNGSSAAIDKTATWIAQTSQNPAQAKHWREVGIIWGDAQPATASIIMSSELDSGGTVVATYLNSKLTRIGIHQGAARCARLTVSLLHGATGEGADVAGISLVYRPYGAKVAR